MRRWRGCSKGLVLDVNAIWYSITKESCLYAEVADMKFKRITVDPEVMFGKPCIRGLRFPVSRILGLLSAGESKDSILKAYPYLEPQDIDEALAYAAAFADEEIMEFA